MGRETRDLFHTLPRQARILFVRLRSMGDCLLLTGPLRALKKEFPRFHVAVLVEPPFSDCFDSNSDVDEALGTLPSKCATLRKLWSRRFDVIVNLHGGPTSLAYTLTSRGIRIGMSHYRYRSLYSGLIPQATGRHHTVETTMESFRWLGVRETAVPRLYYAAHPREARWVRATLGDRPYVVVHPAAFMETKRWRTDGFAQVAQALNQLGWCTVITAGPGEESIAGHAASNVKDSVVLLGLAIPQLAELVRGAALYLGNDAGPMHMAAAVGTPTVAVWGSSDATRWRPWGVAHRIVQNPFECNPCPGYRCLVAETPLCIESVSVDQVISAVESLMKETGRLRPLSTAL